MVLHLTIPEPNKPSRAKDLVIDVLSFEWPLTLTQIYNKVKNNHSFSSTKQALYKAICELLHEEVLLKKDKEYCLNMDWIETIKNFSMQVEKNYKNKSKLPIMEGIREVKVEDNSSVLTFDSLIELDKVWLRIKNDYYKNEAQENEVTFWEGNHCWWLLVYPDQEFNELEGLKKKKVKDFTIIHNDTLLDRAAKKFYQESGIGCIISKKNVSSDMTVFGDTIMQVTLPDELRNNLDEIYKKYTSSKNVDIHYLLKNVLTKKVSLSLVITKNKDIAEHLKQKVISQFN